MEKLKKYKKQIFTFVTIFLLLEFGVFPCLTMANTFANIIGAVALILLILWGGLELYDYVKNSDGWVDKNELKEADRQWKEHIMKQMEEMQKMHKENESLKKKANPKQFDGVESDKPFVKTRKKTNKTK